MRLLEAICLFLFIIAYGTARVVGAACHGAHAVYRDGSDEVARRMRLRGTLALLLVLLLPAGAWAREPWPTLREFLAFTSRQQEDYVRAYMWGAAAALDRAALALDGCVGADLSAEEIAAELRALQITGALAERGRSTNRLLADRLFDGCQLAGPGR